MILCESNYYVWSHGELFTSEKDSPSLRAVTNTGYNVREAIAIEVSSVDDPQITLFSYATMDSPI